MCLARIDSHFRFLEITPFDSIVFGVASSASTIAQGVYLFPLVGICCSFILTHVYWFLSTVFHKVITVFFRLQLILVLFIPFTCFSLSYFNLV